MNIQCKNQGQNVAGLNVAALALALSGGKMDSVSKSDLKIPPLGLTITTFF